MHIIRLAVAALLTAIVISSSPAQAAPKPSFECVRARAPVEIAICSDDALASRDAEMAGLYWMLHGRFAKARKTDHKAVLRDDQREWLAKRLHVCEVPAGGRWSPSAANIACLKAIYTKRVIDLTDLLPLLDAKNTKEAKEAKEAKEVKEVKEVKEAKDTEPVDECHVKDETEPLAPVTVSCSFALGEDLGRVSMIATEFATEDDSGADIRVHIPGNSPVEQRIHLQEADLGVSDDGTVWGIEFGDFNFDGYTDFSVVKFRPVAPNVPMSPWLFDPVNRRFVYNETLSEVTSPRFDGRTRIVSSFQRVAWQHYRFEVWRWEEGRLLWAYATACGPDLDDEYFSGGDRTARGLPRRYVTYVSENCFFVY